MIISKAKKTDIKTGVFLVNVPHFTFYQINKMLFFYFKANIFALAKPTSKLFSLPP